MGVKLRPHQVEGVKWLMDRELNKTPKGGMLCDEMGLGKTLQMIYVICKNKKDRTLIVVPKSIVQQWVSEFKKFAPKMKVCAYDGPHRKFDPEARVCICPYSVLVDLLEHSWDRVILDEGHEIRNKSSLVYKNAMMIRSPIRWIVTGTPVFNKFRDFVSLCEFVGVSKKNVQANYETLREELILRRIKEDPTETKLEFRNMELEMYDTERAVYNRAIEEIDNCGCILEGILRCRQACSWPKMYDPTWDGPTAKMDALVCMIKTHPMEKSLVFTQFIEESKEIVRLLEEKLHRKTFLLYGSVENRDSVIQGFKDCKDPGAVFVIQIKTGGVGLNLQEASRVYITQPSWNPATELQAIARSYRDGQTKKVIVRKLVYAEGDTVDNEITELQILKSEICSRVLGDETIKRQIPEIKFTASNFRVKLGAKNEVSTDSSSQESGGDTA
jgi:SNF2 family DNA or RNA helicase